MTRLAATFVLTVFAIGTLHAQGISIRPARTADRSVSLAHGQWDLRGASLEDMILLAYKDDGVLSASQIAGGPGWMTERFDLRLAFPHAVMVRDLSSTPEEQLRHTLHARFGLRARIEPREAPIYELVQAEPGALGSRLRPASCREPRAGQRRDPRCGAARLPADRVVLGVTMADLARGLSQLPEVGRVVHDATGLSGTFDLDLRWGSGLTLPGALRAELGLMLREARGVVPTVVVDAARRPVSE